MLATDLQEACGVRAGSPYAGTILETAAHQKSVHPAQMRADHELPEPLDAAAI